MKNVAAALFAAILACCAYWSAPAAASEMNLSTWTCKQFQAANKDDVGVISACRFREAQQRILAGPAWTNHQDKPARSDRGRLLH